MRARARIVAVADGRGGTRLAVLAGESPLLPRRTGPVTVHLVGGAAGPLRGDDLRLDVDVEAGATLEIRSVAAQLALPGRPGLPGSRLEIRARVAAGGALVWWPEPLIAAAGCDHLTVTRVDVAEGGALLWRDDLVCGRHGEDAGDARTDTTIAYAGSPLYRHELSVGPDAAGWSGAAVLGEGRAVGTLVGILGPRHPATGNPLARARNGPAMTPGAAITPGSAAITPGSAAMPDGTAVMPLARAGFLAAAVGADIRQVQAGLDPLMHTAPPAVREDGARRDGATLVAHAGGASE